MKALVKFKPGLDGIELRDIPEPVPMKHEIKVKVAAAGLCGSDLHIIHDMIKVNMPIAIGHEFVGIVEEVGEMVTKFKPGDWITSLTTFRSCGQCRYCKEGKVMFCKERKGLGFHVNGAIAEYVLIAEENAILIPEKIEDKITAAVGEPFGCAVRGAMERNHVCKDDLVIICGPGMLGLSAVQIAKRCGATVFVYGLERDRERLQTALNIGADAIFTDRASLEKEVFRCSEYGADVAFEVTGAEACLNMCIDLLRKGGSIAQMGLYREPPKINLNKMTDNEIQLTNNFGCHRSTWEIVLNLMEEKQVDFDIYMENRFQLEQWREAIQKAESKEALKVLFIPNRI